MKTLNIILSGSTGRMGREIVSCVEKDPQIQIISEINKQNAFSEGLSGDVVIDFSLPAFFNEVLEFCKAKRLPLVSGTTGLNSEQKKALLNLSQEIPILWSANMSLGIAIFNEFIKNFSCVAQDFKFQIEEVHHRDKKDRPSGTALFLQESLEKSTGQVQSPPISHRQEAIFGVHRLSAKAHGESLSIEHTALGRDVFARGALKAAHWLVDKPKGFYSIQDVLIKKTV